jgi:hypothetical protein
MEREEVIREIADAHEALSAAYTALEDHGLGDADETIEAMEAVNGAMAMVAPFCGRT